MYRGYLADVDCRWNVIAGSVDDRTEEERGLKVGNLDTAGALDSDRQSAIEARQIQNTQVKIRQRRFIHIQSLDQ